MDYAYATEEPFKGACSSYLHYPLPECPSHGTCHQGYGREMVLMPTVLTGRAGAAGIAHLCLGVQVPASVPQQSLAG